MTASSRMYLILADRISDAQRDKITEVVERDSLGPWWHQFVDAWIASGGSVRRWTDALSPAISQGGPDSIVVFRMPDPPAQRFWSFYAVPSRIHWLTTNYRRPANLRPAVGPPGESGH